MGDDWDRDAFRDRIQRALEEFLDGQAERLAPLGTDAARLLAEARTSVAGGKMFRAGVLLVGATTRSPHPPTSRRSPGPAPRSSCCTPARWSTTT